MTPSDLEPGDTPTAHPDPSSESLAAGAPARGTPRTPKVRRRYYPPVDVSHYWGAPPGTFLRHADGTVYGRTRHGNLVRITFA